MLFFSAFASTTPLPGEKRRDYTFPTLPLWSVNGTRCYNNNKNYDRDQRPLITMLLYQLNTVYDRSFGCQVVVVVLDIKVLCHLFIGCPQTVIFRERSFPSTGPTGRNSLPLNIPTTKSTPAFRQVLNSQVFKNSSPSRYHSIHIITHCTCIIALPVTHYAILFLS